MKKKTKLSSYFAMLILAIGTSSCVNEAYDLNKDIDLTIQAGGDSLALPIGSTEDIRLGDVLELDNDLIQVDADGNYYLEEKSDEAISENITVNQFRTHIPKPDKVDVSLTFEKISLPEIDIPIPGTVNNRLPIDPSELQLKEKYTVNLPSEQLQATFKTDGMDNDVPEEIKSLSHVSFQARAELKLSLNQAFAHEITLENFRIKIPAFLETPEGQFNEKGEQEIVLPTFTLSGHNQHLIEIHLTGIDFSKMDEGEGLVNGKIVIDETVCAYGDLSAYTKSINTDLIDQIMKGGSIQPEIGVLLDANFDDIVVNSIKGIVDPDVNISVDPIQITGIPDFLLDNDVQLDLGNPQLYLKLWNNTPASIDLQCGIKAFKDGVDQTAESPIECKTTIKGNQIKDGWNFLCLSEEKPADLDPKYEWIRTSNLSNLLYPRIPDELQFAVDAKVKQEEIELELGQDFGVNVEYQMIAPFSFGEKFKIVYSDTINGWNESLEKINLTAIDIAGTIKNDIPLDLLLTAKAVSLPDVNGNVRELEEVTATVKTNAGNTIPGASQTPLTIELRSANLEALHQVDGLIYRIEGASNEKIAGKELNENQCLKIENLKLMVLGGITIDLNK